MGHRQDKDQQKGGGNMVWANINRGYCRRYWENISRNNWINHLVNKSMMLSINLALA